ncbi:hypothetical protein [Bdellovibrio sp. HCB209]|uniref:hypothetical protein n=1 Tax=Bdellovibrio sp. HCB209 TaxID=3394354 RepID=UPI0039B6AA76
MASTTDQMVNSGKSAYNKAKDSLNNVELNDADQFMDKVKSGYQVAEDTAVEYADKAMKVAKKNPALVAVGAAGLGLLIGGLIGRSMKKH